VTGFVCGEWHINRVGNIIRNDRVVGHLPAVFLPIIGEWMANGGMSDADVERLILTLLGAYAND
jgi:uncharacterized membrane protein YqaE (UPF0057 family)